MPRHTARIAIRNFVFFLCVVSISQAQVSAPVPNPELKKLQVLVGDWTYTGEYKSGTWGPGSKFTGEYRIRFILRGFVLEGRIIEKNAHGETRFLEIDVPDPATSEITFSEYSDADTSYSGIVGINGQAIVRNGTVTAKGKQFAVKETVILSADQGSATLDGEILEDTKTWLPYFEAKLTKNRTKATCVLK
jgi:hypothetical protein